MATVVNGIKLEDFNALHEELKRNAEFVSKIHKWNARIRWAGSGFNFTSYVRNHKFTISEPSDIGGADTGPSAHELILTALGACYSTGFIYNATKRNIQIKNFEVAIEGEIDDILVFFGLSDKGHPGYKKIVVKAYVEADADEKTIKEIWEAAVKGSPVGNTLQRGVEIVPQVSLVRK
jgi:uncharacterized OsmC-like protein